MRAVSPDWNISVGFSFAAPHHKQKTEAAQQRDVAPNGNFKGTKEGERRVVEGTAVAWKLDVELAFRQSLVPDHREVWG